MTHGKATQTDQPIDRRARWRYVFNVALALAGLAVFVHLVRSSGVTVDMLRALGWQPLAAIFAIFGLVIGLDTVAWYYATLHVARPRMLPLMGLRVAGDALMNGLPGGVVLGETYKAVMMRRLFGVSLTDNAAILLMVKFGLGLSQALFVFVGLILCYPLLQERSVELFGFQGAHYISLAVTVGMGLMMLVPLALMVRGNSFVALGRALGRLPFEQLSSWLAHKEPKLAALDASCSEVLRSNRTHVAITFLALCAGWLVNSLESYVLMLLMGLRPTLAMAYVMESVGSLFRLVFFMLPAGIGGQDASFVALFRLYRLDKPAAGVFVLAKRFKELLWIAVGFALILLMRRAGTVSTKGGDSQDASRNGVAPDPA